MNAKSLRTLDDAELTAVSGGHGHCRRPPPFRPVPYKTVTQSNTVGDVEIFAPGNKGDITVDISQSNVA